MVLNFLRFTFQLLSTSRLQKEVTKGYRGLQGVTGGNKGLQGVTGGYKRGTRLTSCYRGLEQEIK